MAKIIGIGNALVDVLLYLDSDETLAQLGLAKGGMRLIDADEADRLDRFIAGRHSEFATGGSAANTILALALLGDEPGLLGCIGQDEMGNFLVRQAHERGIDVRFVQTANESTGVATTFITPDGERTFATHLGAAAMMAPDMLPTGCMSGYQLIHVEGYLVQNHQLMEHLMQMAKGCGMTVSYDLASYNVVRDDYDFVHHLVKDYVDVVFANREEAAAFSRQDSPEDALSELAELTTTAVVKLGKEGAIGLHREVDGTMIYAEAPLRERVKVVDTTAAGDFFAAGFLHGMIHGYSLADCLDLGNRIAAEVIQVTGTAVDGARLRHAAEVKSD